MSDLPVRRAREGETDYHTLDRYTAAHAATGLAMGLARAPWPAMLVLAVGWEVVERIKPEMFRQRTYDTAENAITDVAAVVLGWAVGYRLTDQYPLAWAKRRTR